MIAFIGKFKVIGILGGMGPEATAVFYARLIQQFQVRYNAMYDADYPEILICNLPLPDVVQSIGNSRQVVSALRYGLKKLESAGADFIVAPCNTICTFYPEIRESIKPPFYSIIEETARQVSISGLRRIGILGTELTLNSGLYEKALGQYEIAVVKPTEGEMKKVSQIILNILKGRKTAEDVSCLTAIIKRMKSSGADGVILGCTELPLLQMPKVSGLRVVDTLQILADFTALRASSGNNNKIAATRCGDD